MQFVLSLTQKTISKKALKFGECDFQTQKPLDTVHECRTCRASQCNEFKNNTHTHMHTLEN